MGEEVAELLVELGGERLVVGKDKRGPASRRDHVGHRERLARTGDAEQGLVLPVFLKTLVQLPNRFRL